MTPAIYELYENIVLNVIESAKIKINKYRKNFMLEIFMLCLSISTRINFLQLGRYSRFGEQRFRRQFEEEFDFFSFNKAMVVFYVGKRNAFRSENHFSEYKLQIVSENYHKITFETAPHCSTKGVTLLLALKLVDIKN